MTTFTSVHHLKFPVSDLEASIDWYGRAFGARREPRFDHHDETGRLYAVMILMPGLEEMPIELRHAPDAAAMTREYDPVTFGVRDEAALDTWIAHLDAEGIDHSEKISGFIGQMIGVPTPDGLHIHIYTDPEGGFANVEMHPEQADIHNAAVNPAVMGSGN